MYKGIGENKGLEVDEELALDYAMTQCGVKPADNFDINNPLHKEFKIEFEGWFFSGNWIKEVDK